MGRGLERDRDDHQPQTPFSPGNGPVPFVPVSLALWCGGRRGAATLDHWHGWRLADQIGTSAMPIDPLLSPLQDNGGPTFTHALLTGSPAIDAADPMTS